MPELGTAWVSVAISAKDSRRDLKKLFDGVDGEARTAGGKAGQKFSQAATQSTNLTGIERAMGRAGDAGGKLLKAGLVTAMAGAATLAGVAVAGVVKTLAAGFDRLKSIDTAKTKLRALGNSAEDVAKIMDNALAAVKGTAFGMDEAATTAASAVAAGIKPGQELQKYLVGVADAAAVSGTSLADMGAIFNKVQTNGRAMTDDLQQLGDRGIPIFQYLQKVTGKTGEEFRKFVEDGGINAALFNQAIQQNIGGAAVIMGQSFEGSVQNAKAAMARLGAAFLTPVFGNAAGGVGSITDALDKMTAWVNAHQAEIVSFFEAIGEAAIGFAERTTMAVGTTLQIMGDLAGGIGNFYAVTLRADAALQRLAGRGEYADELDRQADAAFGWGEEMRKAGDKIVAINFDEPKAKLDAWADSARQAATDAEGAGGKVTGLATALGALPLNKVVAVDADTTAADAKMKAWLDKWSVQWSAVSTATPTPPANGPLIGPAPSLTPPPGSRNPPLIGPNGGRAMGGPIRGAGGPKSDVIPIWASNGEHMLSAGDVAAMGGQGGVYAFRNALHRAEGGNVFGDKVRKRAKDVPWWMPGTRQPWSSGAGPGLQAGADFGTRGPYGFDPEWMFPWWMFPGDGQKLKPRTPERQNRKGIFGFAGGGEIPSGPGSFVVTRDNIMSAIQFAQSVNGNPYDYGGTGPLYDCSGFISAIYGITTGRPLPAGQRYFSTESDFMQLGFAKGFDPNSPLNIGVHNGGGGMNSHMAGTLAGYNVESGGGGGTQFGGSAAGANDPQFENQYHLPVTGAGNSAGSSLSQYFADGLTEGGQAVADKQKDKGGGGGGGMDGSSLGQTIVGGLLQSIGLDGSLFSNPLEWPNVKSLMAGLNFGGGLLQRAMGGGGEESATASGGGGPSLPGLGGFSDMLTPLGPGAAPIGTPASGRGLGPAPGPAVVVNGNVGMDPRGFTQRIDAAKNQAWRRAGMAAVKPQ